MKAAKRIERVRKLLQENKLDAMVVRNTTDLMWLTGFERLFDTEEAHTAVITQDRCIIHTDSRYSTAMWSRAEEEGIWEVDDARVSAADFIAAALAEEELSAGAVAIADSTPLKLYRAYVAKMPEATFVERNEDILALRAVKEPEEVDRLRAAQKVADEAFLETLSTLHPGQTEREVSLRLEINMRKRGADELAFTNIVASGPNSANPHAVASDRVISKGDLVVFDFGARVDGYRSDTTRTVCIGTPTAEQKAIYDAVLRANTTVREQMKAGVTGADMHNLAELILAEAGFGGKMGHALGHGVGLDIHEAPVLAPRNGAALVVGNIVTDEPGVYLGGSNGVRIEDCGVITADGYSIFSTLPHEMQCVE